MTAAKKKPTPEPAGVGNLVIPLDVIVQVLRSLEPLRVQAREQRPILEGVLIDVNNPAGVTFSATDSYIAGRIALAPNVVEQVDGTLRLSTVMVPDILGFRRMLTGTKKEKRSGVIEIRFGLPGRYGVHTDGSWDGRGWWCMTEDDFIHGRVERDYPNLHKLIDDNIAKGGSETTAWAPDRITDLASAGRAWVERGIAPWVLRSTTKLGPSVFDMTTHRGTFTALVMPVRWDR